MSVCVALELLEHLPCVEPALGLAEQLARRLDALGEVWRQLAVEELPQLGLVLVEAPAGGAARARPYIGRPFGAVLPLQGACRWIAWSSTPC